LSTEKGNKISPKNVSKLKVADAADVPPPGGPPSGGGGSTGGDLRTEPKHAVQPGNGGRLLGEPIDPEEEDEVEDGIEDGEESNADDLHSTITREYPIEYGDRSSGT
jgi:hypothetical protein